MMCPVIVEVREPVKNSYGDFINSLAFENTQYLYLAILYEVSKTSFGTLTVCVSSMMSISGESLHRTKISGSFTYVVIFKYTQI